MTTDLHSTGQVATEQAQRYMTQLCKHFGHKIPAVLDGDRATITFEMGTARLTATEDSLQCTVTGADAAAIERLKGVIDSHLARFAFREEIAGLVWQPAA